jgi:predicted ABC-type ATPase
MNRRSKAKLYVIGGPNGAGKTTFAKKFLPVYANCVQFVNADLLAQGLSPFDPNLASLQAGKLLIRQIRALASKGTDFAFETTFAGKSYLPFLRSLKRSGYEIHLVFLWLSGTRLAHKRISDRVRMGGHYVPPEVVERRFKTGLPNFFNAYAQLADSWALFDNSKSIPLLVAKKNKVLEIVRGKLYRKILSKAGIYEKA